MALRKTLLALPLLLACGGSDGDDGKTSGAPLTACPEYAAAVCAATERCDGDWFSAYWGTQSNCQAVKAGECARDTAGPGIAVTNDGLQRCAKALATTACDTAAPECAFPNGTQPGGATCGADLGCASGLCRDDFLECGKCAPLAADGEPCNQVSGAVCKPNSFCDAGTCAPRPTSGNCELGGCAQGFSCNGGTCKPGAKIGETCTTILDCAEGVCDVPNKKCVLVKALPQGASCDVSLVAICGPGLACEFSTGGKGTCVPTGLPGQPCGPSLTNPCAYDLECNEGKCVSRAPLTCGG